MKKTHVFSLVAMGISALFALVLAEFAFRVYVISKYHVKEVDLRDKHLAYYSESLIVFDERFGYSYNPGKTVYEAGIKNGKLLGCSQPHDINIYGNFEKDVSDFRAAESDSKSTSTILVFGDSFTSIPYDGETWVSLFSKKIKKTINPHISVLNFGRDGYGLLQMVELAAEKVEQYKPKLIIFSVINDDMQRKRFWRKMYSEDKAWYVMYDPNDGKSAADSSVVQFVEPRITKSWCENTMANNGEDPMVSELVANYERVAKEQVNKLKPKFFSNELFLLNQIRYGTPIVHKSRMSGQFRFLQDKRFMDAASKLLKSKVPLYFVNLPMLEEMRDRKNHITSHQKELLEEALQIFGKKEIFFLADYLNPSREDLLKFPVTKDDGHPSKFGIQLYAEGMKKLSLDKLAEIKDLNTQTLSDH